MQSIHLVLIVNGDKSADPFLHRLRQPLPVVVVDIIVVHMHFRRLQPSPENVKKETQFLICFCI